MNIQGTLDKAMENGISYAVCHPSLYLKVLEYIRTAESKRDSCGFHPKMELAVHIRQNAPPLVIFDSMAALIRHLAILDA